MTTLLHKTRCPECAKQNKDLTGDNLGVYSDGHAYCFSCGFHSAGTLKDRLNKKTKEVLPLELPEDLVFELPEVATNWLLKYFNYNTIPTCFWSESKQGLFFLIKEEPTGDLLAYIYRYFGENPGHPKWVGYGISNTLYHTLGPKGDTIILVEDLISALRLAQCNYYAMPIFGAHIGLKRLAHLSHYLGVSKVVVWLDEDKCTVSITEANRAMSIGLKARAITTELDPKEYTCLQIQQILI